MADRNPSFFARFVLAFAAFFRTLSSGAFAAGVARLSAGDTSTAGTPGPAAAPRSEPTRGAPPRDEQPTTRAKALPVEDTKPDSALQLLGLFQREGRFIDFLEEDVRSFTDAEIGAAARVVHDGCKKALHEHFTIAPIRSDAEGGRITLPPGFDASEVRLTGNVVGEPPFTGTLQHRGWRVAEVRLPKVARGHKLEVVAPAEVEL